MEIGQKIHELRKQKKMTLEELGNQVGVGKSTIRKWETGMIANMRIDKIVKLAEALQTTPTYLIECSGQFRNLSMVEHEIICKMKFLNCEGQNKVIDYISDLSDKYRK